MRVMLENRERFANAQRPVVRGGEAWILSLSLPVLRCGEDCGWTRPQSVRVIRYVEARIDS
jgi:hypothetical protein